MLSPKLTQQLASYLAKLTNNIELWLSTDGSDKALELQQLADDIASLSPLINVVEKVSVRSPMMTIVNPNLDTQIAFAAVPLGHEFTSLVLALLHLGGHPIKLEADTIKQISQLEGKLEFETYVSLSCKLAPKWCRH